MHSLIGLSEDTTVSYLISLARSSRSLDKLTGTLLSEDWLPPNNPKAQPFIERLYDEFSTAAKASAQ